MRVVFCLLLWMVSAAFGAKDAKPFLPVPAEVRELMIQSLDWKLAGAFHDSLPVNAYDIVLAYQELGEEERAIRAKVSERLRQFMLLRVENDSVGTPLGEALLQFPLPKVDETKPFFESLQLGAYVRMLEKMPLEENAFGTGGEQLATAMRLGAYVENKRVMAQALGELMLTGDLINAAVTAREMGNDRLLINLGLLSIARFYTTGVYPWRMTMNLALGSVSLEHKELASKIARRFADYLLTPEVIESVANKTSEPIEAIKLLHTSYAASLFETTGTQVQYEDRSNDFYTDLRAEDRARIGALADDYLNGMAQFPDRYPGSETDYIRNALHAAADRTRLNLFGETFMQQQGKIKVFRYSEAYNFFEAAGNLEGQRKSLEERFSKTGYDFFMVEAKYIPVLQRLRGTKGLQEFREKLVALSREGLLNESDLLNLTTEIDRALKVSSKRRVEYGVPKLVRIATTSYFGTVASELTYAGVLSKVAAPADRRRLMNEAAAALEGNVYALAMDRYKQAGRFDLALIVARNILLEGRMDVFSDLYEIGLGLSESER